MKKTSNLPITVLKMPPQNLLIKAQSPSLDYELFHVAGKKICIEAYKTKVPKSKLYTNLEIYEWRTLT